MDKNITYVVAEHLQAFKNYCSDHNLRPFVDAKVLLSREQIQGFDGDEKVVFTEGFLRGPDGVYMHDYWRLIRKLRR